MKETDTICAISTAISGSAINIIRISGEDSIKIANGILSGLDLTKAKGNTISHASVKDKDGNIIDEVLVSLFRAPKSYTKEDVVEINTHGGAFVTTQVLELLLNFGARLAEPGEFTKRAFLNGRIDLSQAEAVMDMIDSSTKNSLLLANKALKGDIKTLVEGLRAEIEDVLLHITVNIDYPEYTDELQITNDLLKEKTKYLISKIEKIIVDAESLRYYKEGIKTVILGKPNVGKSSLLNALLKENKAIVTSFSGTTRDIVEGDINLGGIILHLIDTAGIRKTDDPIEKIGIEKSIEKLYDAELVLLVLDQSQDLTFEDKELLEKTKNKTRIIIGNKSDLPKANLNIKNVVDVSSLKQEGLENLKDEIKKLFIKDSLKISQDLVISSSRHISIMKRALDSLKDARNNAINGDFLDMVEIDLREAYNALGEIIGRGNPDELIDELFARFCLGK